MIVSVPDAGMRRGLSISLILLLWLGPFAAVMPGIDESRLPFCCRRHGAHHCAMDAEMGTPQSDAPAVSAPSRCPHVPAGMAVSTTPAFAQPQSPAGWPASVTAACTLASYRNAARSVRLRTLSGRGPPSSRIA